MADATTTQNINYGFAPEAAPYAQDVLGQAQALTDINQNPYQQYQGDTIAQFTPLQNLAFGNAATMTSAPQLEDASALAGMAGLGALNQQYTFQPSNFTAANAQAMMNPYTDVMDQATRRNAAIAQQQQQAQAATRGAFGGSGDYLMRAQGNADLQRQLGQNQYNAFQNAQQQYNTQQQQNAQQQQFGAGLGLQGLQTALTGANALSNIGQTQYGQNMGINQLQAQYGGAQQQQVQNALNQQQQQFLNYQNYPYQQLNFMQNMIRGLPMTNQTASVYQSPGSMLGQVAGLGIGAAAALNKKDGGSISSYKEGGEVKKYSGDDEESLVRLNPFAMKQLMGDATMSGAGLNANADLREAGRLSGGVNLNRMDKNGESRQMQALMANYMNNIGDVGVNANVTRPLERGLPADFYQTNLMGSVPVGEGRVTVGKHGTHAEGGHHTNSHSLAYNTPFHGGHLNAHVNKPVEGRPSFGVQYNTSFSEGGDIGDITDPSEGKLHRMISSLSDEQLQQILQHPTSMAEFEAAQQVMSFRQSMHQGMREGGAVAFKEGGDKGEESSGLGPLAYLAATAPALYQMGKAALSKIPFGTVASGTGRTLGSAGSAYMAPTTGPVIGGGMALSDLNTRYLEAHPEAREAMLGDIGSDAAFASAILNEGAKTKEKKSEYESKVGGGRGIGDYSSKYDVELAKKSASKPDKNKLLQDEFNKSGLGDVAKHAPSIGEARKVAEGMGVKAEDFDSIYNRVLGDLSKGNADIIKSIRELTAEQVGEAKNIKAEGDRKALMNFGFNLAAEASRPGVAGNKGFAGLLRSAAAASPSYAASLADTEKMARESQRLANQMQVEMVKYQVALDKNDKSTAVQAAHNIMNNKIQQQQVNNAYEHGKAIERLEGQKIGMMGQRYAAMQGNNAFKFGNFRKQAIAQADKNYADELRNDIMLPKKLKEQGITPEQYKKRRADEIYGSILQSMSGPLMPLEE
jgi:hypothetical protein